MADTTWNQWRTTLGQQTMDRNSGETSYETDSTPNQQADDEFDDQYDEEPEDDGQDDDWQEDEPEEAPAAATGGSVQMSEEALERIFNRQQEQFQKQQRETAQYLQQLARPQHQETEQISAPTFRQLRQAIEENDMEKYEQLLAQQSTAQQLQIENKFRQLAGEAMQYFNRYDEHIARTSVPEYSEYEEAINKIKEDLPPIPREYMNHPGVRRLFVNAARGMNIDQEVQRRNTDDRQQRRRRSNPQTSAPTNSRQQTRANARQRNRGPVFTDEAFAALRAAGRTPEQHARSLGYESWAAYERATQEKYDNWDEMNIPSWRRNRG